jgi:hypothetical protein
MMRWIWDLPTIISVVALLVPLALQGVISLEFAAFALVGLVGFQALGRVTGGHLGRTIRFLFRVGLPVVSLLTLAVRLGGGDPGDTERVLNSLITLLIVVIGFWLLLFGFAWSNRKR